MQLLSLLLLIYVSAAPMVACMITLKSYAETCCSSDTNQCISLHCVGLAPQPLLQAATICTRLCVTCVHLYQDDGEQGC